MTSSLKTSVKKLEAESVGSRLDRLEKLDRADQDGSELRDAVVVLNGAIVWLTGFRIETTVDGGNRISAIGGENSACLFIAASIGT